MPRPVLVSLLAVFIFAVYAGAAEDHAKFSPEAILEAENVVWTTPSSVSTESMPLSGGLLGLNVWVENGALRMLMASTDSQDERGFQVKLGVVTVKLGDGNAFASAFRQELRLLQSEIAVSGRTSEGAPVEVKVWCVANRPVFHVQMQCGEPLDVEARYESWSGHQVEFVRGALRWRRRCAPHNKFRRDTIQAKKMEAFSRLVPDPLSNLTVGGMMTAPELVPAGTWKGTFNKLPTTGATLKSARPLKSMDMTVTLRMEQDATAERWNNELLRATKKAMKSTAKDREESRAWWSEFWNRSYIHINPRRAGSKDEGWLAGRNYQLCRYQLAANVSGRMPTLFNGGSFVCDGNPDQRAWIEVYYMAQNMRPMYWPLLKCGDFDMMGQPFAYYRERAPMQRAYARQWWGVKDGLVFPEAIDPFGTDALGIASDGRSQVPHLRYHHTGCMEFAWMMLQYAAFTGEDIRPNLSFIEGIVRYYDNFYQRRLKEETGRPLDQDGHLVIRPSKALEVVNECTNSVTDLTGLTAIVRGLLALPDGVLSREKKAYYEGFLKRIPPLTIVEKNGRKIITPGKAVGSIFSSPNMEFPELYVCFPFDYFFLGRQGADGAQGIELAKNTWDVGGFNPPVQKQALCWYQSAINLARMGRATDAKQYTLRKLVSQPSMRFPTFYSNPGFCCMGPDTDHIGMGMIGLQEMLMQTDGRRILLAPAWPIHWNCDFKLHAPLRTTVRGHIERGKVVVEQVTPEERRKDVEILGPSGPAPPLSEGQPVQASGFYGPSYEPEKAVDGDPTTPWVATLGSKSSWLEVDLEEPLSVSRIVIRESAYQFVRRHAVQAQMEDGSWRTLFQGTTIGPDYSPSFTPVKARRFRLQVLESINHASIEEFRLLPE